MHRETLKATPKKTIHTLAFLKYGSILLLLVTSVLVVACGTGNGASSTDSQAQAAATITLNGDLSPTPTLAPYQCGAWVTKSSPYYDPRGSVPIYGKFTKNADGNPEGIAQATALAYVQWGDYTTETLTGVTGTDGLVVFQAAMGPHPSALNKLTLVTVTFTQGSLTCKVDTNRPASFVLQTGKTTPTDNPEKKSGGGNTPQPSSTPGNPKGRP